MGEEKLEVLPVIDKKKVIGVIDRESIFKVIRMHMRTKKV